MSMDTQPIKRTGAPKAPSAMRGPSAPSPTHHMDNPFLNEEEFVLPHVPDDEEWHYCWIRYRIGRDDDLKNMTRYLTGKLPFELATEEMLPDVVKTQFSHLKISTGSQSGKIGIGDVVLARTPQPLYQKYIEATQIRADRMNAALTDTIQSVRDRRTRLIVEEDSERDGIMPGRAERV